MPEHEPYLDYVVKKLEELRQETRFLSKEASIIQVQNNTIDNIKSQCKYQNELPVEEEIYFTQEEWNKLTREKIEKDFTWQLEDSKEQNRVAFKTIQSRSFQNSMMKALYGEEALETYEESNGL